MLTQHILLVVFWIFFSFFHSVFAISKWKLHMKKIMQNNFKYYRLLYSCFAAVTLIFIICYNFSIKSKQLWQVSTIEIILSVVGIVISSYAMIIFTKKFFFELSGADILIEEKSSGTLLQTGFYKYVRHPLYTATLLLIWSLFLLQPQLSNLLTCICITVYTITGITFEEKKLIANFGVAYIDYQKSTPMLLPKIIIN